MLAHRVLGSLGLVRLKAVPACSTLAGRQMDMVGLSAVPAYMIRLAGDRQRCSGLPGCICTLLVLEVPRAQLVHRHAARIITFLRAGTVIIPKRTSARR